VSGAGKTLRAAAVLALLVFLGSFTGVVGDGPTATWYCGAGSPCTADYPDRPGVDDLYAAAGSELRVGDWRGSRVIVCHEGRCVPVRLIDSCVCGGNRVIDLYSDAFQRLAPLSQGVIAVRVSTLTVLRAGATLPNTTTEGE
jgi:hypothetical protein